VELVMTMIIIGIIGAVAAPRFFSNDVFQERGAADQIRAALRYGQKIAVAQRRVVNVNISSVPAANANCGTELVLGEVNCAISNRVTVANATYQFNGLGQPVPNAAVTITVGATSINIAVETGYVF
jgi:MSHA pilin protein MshC